MHKLVLANEIGSVYNTDMVENVITNLTDKELAVIKAVDELGFGSVIQIAKKAGIKRTTVYNFANKLVDARLLGVDIVNGSRRYFAPNNTLSVLEVKETGEAPKRDNLIVLVNAHAIKREINKTLKSKRVDWLIGSPASTDLLGKHYIEAYISKAMNCDLNLRTLRSPLTEPNHKFGSEEVAIESGRILRRTHENLPISTTIIIDEKCTIFVSPVKGGVGYKIVDVELAKSMKLMFDDLWKYSKVIGEE